MALMSGKVYSNTGAPNNADGVNGDIYMQLDGFKTTYRKEGGAWVAVGSTLGAIPEFVSGVGAPSNSLGTDGQYYRETSSQSIYYKQGSVWNLIGKLLGASFGSILDLAGVGKDLSTPPNLISSGSLNAVVLPGEYCYEGAVLDKPTNANGLLKVWREDVDYIYQIAHISDTGKLSSRYSNDGGANWTSWFDYGRTQGYRDVDFQVSGGTQPNSAVSYGQLATLLLDNGFSANDTAFNLSISLPNGYILKMGYTEYGELPAGVVTVPTTFTNAFPSTCLFALANPYNPNLTGQMTFICTMRTWSNVGISVDMVELAGSGNQFNASYVWFAIGK